MTAKKQKEKERRRARKMAEEAWEAVDSGNLDLAQKLIQRAVSTQPDNPRLWNDRGQILVLCDNTDEADRSFRYAIRLARDFAEPYHHLAALRARQDRLDDAVGLEADAVRLAPDNAQYAEDLRAYQLEAEQQKERLRLTPAPSPPEPFPAEDLETIARETASWGERLASLDWERLGERLTREGCVVLPGLLTPDECSWLRSLYADDSQFDRTVEMNEADFGKGEYRYFRAPIPTLLGGLRRAVYGRAAAVANSWQELLNEAERYPANWEGFRDQCRQAGQGRPTVILLKYGPGGFNALHRDLRGRIFFPLQFAVVLSPRADQDPAGFQGGDFLLCDVPEGLKAKRREVAAGLGDGILFCTRDRLVSIGGAWGLQPVKHGVTPITSGERLVLGMPFHEYR